MVDHLKAVGVAIKKSPQAIRKKFVGDRAGHEGIYHYYQFALKNNNCVAAM